MSGIPAHEQQIVPVMVGTAGHVDHGKTALVKLLTGCDTDLLPEEKARGMSIDLGFAPFALEDGRMVGIIDVPGHEDFIRNMVAGASSIDVLLLVIAADDGIMPQTIEHLKIVSLLRTPQVMAVITKTDLVGAARQQEVRESVAAFLAEYGFPEAPIIFESNKTGDGINDVREAIRALVKRVERPSRTYAFRMNIERAFSIEGYGTVVTGIPMCGECAVGDDLELFPGPRRVFCRAVQKYNRDSRDAQAHACSAINIRGVKVSDIERGMTLCAPGAYRQTCAAILAVRNVHESMKIKRRQELRFCCGTSHRVASCLLVGSDDSLNPGQDGFMRIKFQDPVVLAAGDRCILRSLSPSATVAGGVVLTVNGDPGPKKPRIDVDRLEAARSAVINNDPFLGELLAGALTIVGLDDLPWLVQEAGGSIKKYIDEKTALGILTPIGSSRWMVKDRVAELEGRFAHVLAIYHKENGFSSGMPAGQARRVLGLDNDAMEGLKKVLGERGAITVRNDFFSLKGFNPALTAKQKEAKERIMQIIAEAGKAAVALGTLQDQLGPAGAQTQLLVHLLSEEGAVTVIDRYLFSTPAVNEFLKHLRALFAKEKTVELGRFREVTGLSRNTAVLILEYFDLKGITRREGKGRVLMSKVT